MKAATCTVPGCGGRLVEGTNAQKESIRWCVACERRIAQLQTLTDRAVRGTPAEPAAAARMSKDETVALTRSLTDAQVLELYRKRWLPFNVAHGRAKVNPLTLRSAIQRRNVLAVKTGPRSVHVSVSSLDHWVATRPKRGHAAFLKLRPHLPTSRDAAVTPGVIAAAVSKKEGSVASWLQSHGRKHGVLRVPAESNGKLVWAYYLGGENA